MNEPLVSILLVLGGLFSAVAGIGVLRLPDVLVRMHASTKAGTLGVGLIVLGVAAHFDGTLAITKAILIVVFLLLTAPVGAHLIGRAAYRSGTPLWEGTVVDERARMNEARHPLDDELDREAAADNLVARNEAVGNAGAGAAASATSGSGDEDGAPPDGGAVDPGKRTS